MNILKVDNLHKSYSIGFIPKSQKVLSGVSFHVEAGKVTGFLGGNGAGKTTTMKCFLGLATPDSGEITFFGGNKLDLNIKQKIGFLPERPYFYDYLTGEEFLKFYGEISRVLSKKDIKSRIDYLLKKVDLEFARDKKLRGYSKGMLQKIGLAQALIHNPEFVILDEPMAGLDPDGRFYLSELINDTAKKGTAVFFSSHLLHDAERMCENLVILKNGKVIFDGETNNLLKKVGQSVSITYLLDGKVNVESVEAGAELQSKIDDLRKKKNEILEVKENRVNLEKAFKEIAL